ncbi:Uncharacterised protein [Chryseobacterium taklimakanense]|uniref:DUF3127 domain-containing protein n=1 Tax=Chryseobacterium taklimakanense TaxID=536441 RepID=A0A239WTF5_9FLAO|nr:hypothetical protein [Chryseobacterium taklimakanense]SNV37088.1 Uncharacterised protein [Chryseobacterium taklimakanense]
MEEYDHILVESFITHERGKHGLVHIRPLPNQEPYTTDMYVQCSKTMSNDFPVGTKFRIKAKIIYPENKKPFVSTHYTWKYEVLKD